MQQIVQLLGKLIHCVELRQEMYLGVQDPVVHHSIPGKAGGVENLEMRACLERLVREPPTVDAGHHDVGKQEFHVGGYLQKFQSCGSGSECSDPVAEFAKARDSDITYASYNEWQERKDALKMQHAQGRRRARRAMVTSRLRR